MVLSRNKELSVPIHAEPPVPTLPYVIEDGNSTSAAPLALGIEEVNVKKSGDLHLPLLEGLVLPLLDRYMVRGLDCSASNGWFTRIKMSISAGRANSQDLLEAYNLLRARLEADERATLVIGHYHPEFIKHHSIDSAPGSNRWRWPLLSREEWGAFATVLKPFLHDCRDRQQPYRLQYSLPRRFAIAAAFDRGLSPSELRELLESMPKETLHAKLYPSSWKTVEDLDALIEERGDNKH
ncbi:hypothetical protein M405DRAFT_839859 [Rhizopogon salebrosus TDB-379]|nr:hypothetical protein M405DRAFT_839859 [Rhizopogon salebrosus TDB-379]